MYTPFKYQWGKTRWIASIGLLWLCVVALQVAKATPAPEDSTKQGRLWLGGTVALGRVASHTPKLGSLAGGIHWQVGPEVVWQPGPHRRIAQLYNNPLFGVNVVGGGFQRPQVLGQYVGMMPWALFPIGKGFLGERVLPFFQIGFGFSVMNRPYDVLHNPGNIAIGSHLNCLFGVAGGFSVRMPQGNRLQVSGTFKHLSNSNVVLPNLGLNPVGIELRLLHRMGPPVAQGPPAARFSTDRRFHVNVRTALGFKQSRLPGGPTFHTYSAFAAVQKEVSRGYALNVGGGVQFNGFAYSYILANNNFVNESDKRNHAWRGEIYAGNEVYVGPVGMLFQAGVYVRDGFLLPYRTFSRIGLELYARDMNRPRVAYTPYCGVYLRAHAAQADFLEVAVGVVL